MFALRDQQSRRRAEGQGGQREKEAVGSVRDKQGVRVYSLTIRESGENLGEVSPTAELSDEGAALLHELRESCELHL